MRGFYNNVKTIEAHYANPTRWDLEIVVDDANRSLETEYTIDDIEHIFVRYNTLHVRFEDGDTYEEEGGYIDDSEVDWKYPSEEIFLSGDYKRIYLGQEEKDWHLTSAAPDLLAAAQEAVEEGRKWFKADEKAALRRSMKSIAHMMTVLQKAIAKAKGEKQ